MCARLSELEVAGGLSKAVAVACGGWGWGGWEWVEVSKWRQHLTSAFWGSLVGKGVSTEIGW